MITGCSSTLMHEKGIVLENQSGIAEQQDYGAVDMENQLEDLQELSGNDVSDVIDGMDEENMGYLLDAEQEADQSMESEKEIEIEIEIEKESETDMTFTPVFTINELDEAIRNRITGISYPADDTAIPVKYDELRYLRVSYVDFNGENQVGELICNRVIAQDLIEIFEELYANRYQIEKIRLVDEYDADDERSMADNNSSAFNYRVIYGTNRVSKHGLGMAIDINPLYNPYITSATGVEEIQPANAYLYVDREMEFPYKIDHDDLCYRLFTAHGFSWGGDWIHSKDYQHFEKKLELTEK